MIKIILGDPTYPKSEAFIVPANTKGIMTHGILKQVVREGWNIISNEVDEIMAKNQFVVGDYFITGPGRLKRRGVKKIYHAIIKRLPSDFTSITIVSSTLNKVLKKVIKDKMKSVTICAVGVDSSGLDTYSAAIIIVEQCNKFMVEIEIKIIDDNKNFIKDVNTIMKLK